MYADSRAPRDHALACLAAVFNMPDGSVLAGPSAAFLHGVEHAARFTDDVHAIVAAQSHWLKARGIRFHAIDLYADEICRIQGMPCTSALRTAWDVAGWLPAAEAAAIVDTLLARDCVRKAELLALAQRRQGERGSVRARKVFTIADPRSQSPQESRLRTGVILAGLPIPQVQFPVAVRGGLILHPDLAWPRYKVALEYDGQWHDAPGQFHLDRRRLNLLVAEGWIVLHVTSRRMRTDMAGVVRELRQALTSRGWRG